MTYFLLLLAILAPFVALKLAIFLLDSRLNAGVRQNAAATHYLANALSQFGVSLGEGLQRFGSAFPTAITLRHQHETILADTQPGSDEPLPADVLSYLAGWNEQWARDEELRYLRGLKARLGSWDAALQSVIVADHHTMTRSDGAEASRG